MPKDKMNGSFYVSVLVGSFRLVREAVAVFDWAMENMSIWASLDIESRNAKTLGRAYTCGVSNMGRYPFETQVTRFTLLAIYLHTLLSAARCSQFSPSVLTTYQRGYFFVCVAFIDAVSG